MFNIYGDILWYNILVQIVSKSFDNLMESRISSVLQLVGNESLRAQVLTVNLHQQPVGNSLKNDTVIFTGIPNEGTTLTPVMNITVSSNNVSASKR